MKVKWAPLEHQIYRELKPFNFRSEKWLVGVSGGADSVALLSLLAQLQAVFGYQLVVVHFHHGRGGAKGYRQKAQTFVTRLASHWNIPVIVRKHQGEVLNSEEKMRQWRHSEMRKIFSEQKAQKIVLAHHSDDLLETRLFRLIRGTGAQGLVSMNKRDGVILRPLLKVSRKQIIEYLKERKISWLEDPSNRDLRFFRNWLRHKWLKQLEKYYPGASRSLARSLELISQTQNAKVIPQKKAQLALSDILSLPATEQRSMVHLLMRKLGLRPTQGQVKEIIKHLDIAKKVHNFGIGGAIWQVKDGVILCYPESRS